MWLIAKTTIKIGPEKWAREGGPAFEMDDETAEELIKLQAAEETAAPPNLQELARAMVDLTQRSAADTYVAAAPAAAPAPAPVEAPAPAAAPAEALAPAPAADADQAPAPAPAAAPASESGPAAAPAPATARKR